MPLYINLSYLDGSDTQALLVLLEVLCRLQERYAYIKFIDRSEKNTAALHDLGAQKTLDRLLLDYPCQPVSCTA